MANATYGRLDQTLRSFGFHFHGVTEKNRVYHHEGTGALVVYPDFPPDDEVLPRHLVTVRTTLDNYGVADPPVFDARLAGELTSHAAGG